MTTFFSADANWSARYLSGSAAILLDSRPAADYWTGHWPGARHVDAALFVLQTTDAAALARFHALLAWTFSALGITPQTEVVVTGGAAEVNASRVAWALAYAGVERVGVLDGGLAAHGDQAPVTEAPAVVATPFKVQPQSRYLATADQVLAMSNGTGTSTGKVLDARERDEYEGQRANAPRKGRVPHALHWDTANEVTPQGLFSDAGKVNAALAGLVGANDEVVLYCGGGGRAARSFMALQLAGHANAAVYPASWNEWGRRNDLPVESPSQAQV